MIETFELEKAILDKAYNNGEWNYRQYEILLQMINNKYK